jgi:hypothetical protein
MPCNITGYLLNGAPLYIIENWGKNFWLFFILLNSLIFIFTGLFYKLGAKFVNYIRFKLFSPEYVKKYRDSLRNNELFK